MSEGVVYCAMCGFPAFYCSMRSINKQKQLKCAQWLKKANNKFFDQIYSEDLCEKLQLNKEPLDNFECGEECEEEEVEVEQTLGAPPIFGLPLKPHQKKQEGYVPFIQVREATRGTQGTVTQIWGYKDFPDFLPKIVASTLSKKFAASCAITKLQDTGEDILALQGAFQTQVYAYLTGELKIPKAQVVIAKQAKFRGKKRAKPVKKNQGHVSKFKQTL